MSYRDRITIEPGKRGGKPCIRGMRITVYEVAEGIHNNELHPGAYGGKRLLSRSSGPDPARLQSGSKPLKTAHFRAWSLAVPESRASTLRHQPPRQRGGYARGLRDPQRGLAPDRRASGSGRRERGVRAGPPRPRRSTARCRSLRAHYPAHRLPAPTAGAVWCRAARRCGTCRIITSCSGRPAGRTSRRTG